MSTVDELLRQQRAVTQRIGQLQQEVEDKRHAVAFANAALDEAIAAELRGISTPADFAAAKGALDHAQLDLNKAESMQRLAGREASKIDMELMNARAEEKRALIDRIRSEATNIEARIRKDAKLRDELLQIYGLWSSTGDGIADWDVVLSGIFAVPTTDEHDSAIVAAKQKLGIQR